MRALPLLLVDFYCDFYQEKQRSRDRAPVLSADEYAIVLNGPVLSSHFPGNSHEQNLLHRRVCTIIEAITMHYIGGWDKTVRDRLAPPSRGSSYLTCSLSKRGRYFEKLCNVAQFKLSSILVCYSCGSILH